MLKLCMKFVLLSRGQNVTNSVSFVNMVLTLKAPSKIAIDNTLICFTFIFRRK